ncbi:MAG: hypothetical protein ACI9QA_000786 [Methanobacteriota archaeon]
MKLTELHVLCMSKKPVPFGEGSRSILGIVSAFLVLIGYALAGFGAILILDGGIRVVSMVLQHGVLVAPRSVSVEFVTAVSLVVAGVVVFIVGRFFAGVASARAQRYT